MSAPTPTPEAPQQWQEEISFAEMLEWYRNQLATMTERVAMLEVTMQRKNREIEALKGGAQSAHVHQ